MLAMFAMARHRDVPLVHHGAAPRTARSVVTNIALTCSGIAYIPLLAGYASHAGDPGGATELSWSRSSA